MNKRIKSLMISGVLILGLSMPTEIEAKSYSSSRSYSSHTSRPSTSKISISRPSSTTKVSTFKPTTSKSIPKVNKSKPKVNLSKSNAKAKTTVKADSGKFSTKSNKSKISNTTKASKTYSVKPKIKTKVKTKHHKTYYTHYSNQPIHYNRGLSFWDYYMLSEIFDNDDQVTQRDIARELENQGYSESEVDNILNDADKEQKNNFIGNIVLGIATCGVIGVLIFTYLKFRK